MHEIPAQRDRLERDRCGRSDGGVGGKRKVSAVRQAQTFGAGVAPK